jgi:hypothetical protein
MQFLPFYKQLHVLLRAILSRRKISKKYQLFNSEQKLLRVLSTLRKHYQIGVLWEWLNEQQPLFFFPLIFRASSAAGLEMLPRSFASLRTQLPEA